MALTDNLIAVWHMNNDWQDSWGTNHGTAYGATFDTSIKKLGSHAGSLDGVDDWISIAGGGSLDIGAGDFTIQAWVYTTQVANQGLVVWDKQIETIRLYIYESKFYFDVRDVQGDLARAISTTTINTDTWYHVVAVREGTTARIYVNGVLEHSATNALLGNVSTSGDHWHLGVLVEDADFHTWWLKGRLDEVAIAGRVWQQADVTESYNGGAGGGIGAILQRLHERTSRGVNRGLGRGMR